MPPIDSKTPAVELNDEDKVKWKNGLAWEKSLDEQREHQLIREGLFWHDEQLDGLSDDDRMWEIIKMSFLQVATILDSVGLAHYFEYFLERGILGAKHMRLLTLKYVQTKMPEIEDPKEQSDIVEAAANSMMDEEMRLFEARYGDIDRLVLDCQHARRFLSEKLLHDDWMIDQYDLTAPLHLEASSHHTKWSVPKVDYESFGHYADWVAATGCDGFLFLWPVIEGNRVPPVVRCKKLHNAPCADFVVDWQHMEAVTCGIDNKVNLYRIKEETIEFKRDKHDNQGFLCVAADVGTGRVALGTNFGWIKILDFQTKEFVSSLIGHQDHCKALAVDWEKNLVVSCSWDSYVHLYDLRSAKLAHRLTGHNSNCYALDVDFESMVAVSSANEYRFMLWDLRERKLLQSYESPGHNVNCMSLDAENGKLATASDDGLVKIWNLHTEAGEEWETSWENSLDCKHNMTVAMDVDWQLGRLVTASWDYNVDMWNLTTGEHLHHFFKPRRCMTQVRMSK